MSTKRQEIHALTGVRGIAATVVMFYHFNASALMTGVAATMLGHGYLMVDLFLILSGFIIAMVYGRKFEQNINSEDFKNFLIRRIARIYPLYVITTLTAAALVASGWMDHWAGPEIPVSTLVDLTMLQSILHIPSLDTPGWSVSAEWVANLLFPLLALLCMRLSWRWIGLVAAIAFATLPFISMLPALIDEPKRAGILDIWNYETVYPVIRCIADFTLGIIVFRVSHLGWIKNITAFKFTAPILLLLILGLMTIKSADVWIVALFPVFILALIPGNNIVSRMLSTRPIYKLGELSYAIYLIHNQMNYFILALARQLESFGLSQTSAHVAAMFVFVGFVILLADFSYRLIEKPARHWINGFVIKKHQVAYQVTG
jgi:peptidoglycan/LPS O-acetylase OafA/YrhL